MYEVYKAIGRIAAQDVPVRITSESGTGKELVDQPTYRHGRRADSPFRRSSAPAFPSRCGIVSLFGHKKGACRNCDSRIPDTHFVEDSITPT